MCIGSQGLNLSGGQKQRIVSTVFILGLDTTRWYFFLLVDC
jgi:hypothetical protein